MEEAGRWTNGWMDGRVREQTLINRPTPARLGAGEWTEGQTDMTLADRRTSRQMDRPHAGLRGREMDRGKQNYTDGQTQGH